MLIPGRCIKGLSETLRLTLEEVDGMSFKATTPRRDE
jgi:hypothetical protein